MVFIKSSLKRILIIVLICAFITSLLQIAIFAEEGIAGIENIEGIENIKGIENISDQTPAMTLSCGYSSGFVGINWHYILVSEEEIESLYISRVDMSNHKNIDEATKTIDIPSKNVTTYKDTDFHPSTVYSYTLNAKLKGGGVAFSTTAYAYIPEIVDPGEKIVMLKIGEAYMNLNGESQEIDTGRDTVPLIINGRTMIPIRSLVEGMGGKVDWTSNEQKITITNGKIVINMWLNNTTIDVNGEKKIMDVVPQVINGRTFVPVRFVAQNLNCRIEWNSNQQIVTIAYKGGLDAPLNTNSNTNNNPNVINPQNSKYLPLDYNMIGKLDETTTSMQLIPSINDQTIIMKDEISVTIQGGTLLKEETVSMKALPTTEVNSKILQSLSLFDVKIGNEVSFNKDLVIEAKFDSSTLDPNYPKDSQVIAAKKDDITGKWLVLPSKVSETTSKITAWTNHLCSLGFFIITPDQLSANNIQQIDKTPINEEDVVDIKQSIINAATSAYNSISKTAEEADAFYRENLLPYIDRYINSDYQKLFDSCEVVVSGRYMIAYSPYDVNKVENNSTNRMGSYITSLKNVSFEDAEKRVLIPRLDKDNKILMEPLEYGKNYFSRGQGKILSRPNPDYEKLIYISRYVLDMAYALNQIEAKYRNNNITIPDKMVPIITYKCDNIIPSMYVRKDNVLVLPINYISTDQMIGDASHELFHEIQYNGYLKEKMASHTWLAEVTAEYASLVVASGRDTAGLMSLRPLTKVFFDSGAVSTGNEREYEAVHFMDFLVRNKGLDFSKFMEHCKTLLAKEDPADHDIIQRYFQDKDGAIPLKENRFANIYADFVADVFLGMGPQMPTYNVYKNGNYATKPIYPDDNKTISVENFVLPKITSGEVPNGGLDLAAKPQPIWSWDYSPAFTAVKLELDSSTGKKTRDFEIELNSYITQTVFVYQGEENIRMANPRPIKVIEPSSNEKFTISITKPCILYFMSLDTFAHYSTDKPNLKIREIQKINAKYIDTTSREFSVSGYDNTYSFEWSFGDGKNENSTSLTTVHKYDYKFQDAKGGSSPFDDNVVYDSKTYDIKVNVRDKEGKLVDTINSTVILLPFQHVSGKL